MRIETLHLGDFGCFDRARIDGLEPGVTVIAGPQRAGKTTFMNAVRCLGYGVPRDGSVPPATNRYDLAADVVVDGDRYRLSIDGHADPELTALDGAPDRSVSDAFGGLAATHYRQLYTISLDELSRLPAGLDDDADLAAILLSAAYGDVRHVPAVRDSFASEAKSIGGKHAAARGVYDMKEPLATIRAGIDDREAAVAQVKAHTSVTETLAEVTERIEALDRTVDELTAERTRLEAVRSCHDDYENLRAVETRLEAADVDADAADRFPLERLADVRQSRETFAAALDAVRAEEDAFEAAVDAADPAAYLEGLLAAREDLREGRSQLSGWRERVRGVREREEALRTREQELEREAATLHPAWEGDLERVAAVDTDVISGQRLRAAVETVRSASEAAEALTADVDELETRLAELETRIDEAEPAAGDATLSDQYPVAAVGVVLGLVAGLVSGSLVGFAFEFVAGSVAGVLVTTVVLVATGARVASRIEAATLESDGVSVDALAAERETVESRLAARRASLADRRATLADAAGDLEDLSARLGLPDDVPPRAVETVYDDLIDLQEGHRQLREERRVLAERRADLRGELEAVAATLVDLSVLEADPVDPVGDAEALFATVERVTDQLAAAEDVAAARRTLDRAAADLAAHLEAWADGPELDPADHDGLGPAADAFLDRGEAVEAFEATRTERERLAAGVRSRLTTSAVEPTLEPYREPTDGEEWHLAACERVLAAFEDADVIEDRLEAIEVKQQELADERSDAVERRVDLEREREALASDDDVRAAHATIEAGRKRLEPIAEEYAALRIAETLLDDLHDRLIERTTGPLLAEASDILERITGETYARVESTDEFDRLDFEASRADGTVHRSAQLSRATAEQLFLAIRLARIRRHEEPLPVLLDDSLTNFDPVHVDRTLEAIAELAAETQVFVLTCHPALLERLEATCAATYWRLDDGTFDGPDEDSSAACEHLRRATEY